MPLIRKKKPVAQAVTLDTIGFYDYLSRTFCVLDDNNSIKYNSRKHCKISIRSIETISIL